MLTNNFSKFYSWRTYKNMEGGNTACYQTSYNNIGAGYFQYSGFYQLGVTLDVGFGDTAPEKTDYVLADGNYANRKLDCISTTRTFTQNEIITAVARFKNNGESPVTVKEVGLYYCNSGDQSGVTKIYGLIARSVLETPVTIGVGESYAFTYTIDT